MRKLILLLVFFSTPALASETYRMQVITKDQTEFGEYTDAQYFNCNDSKTFAACKEDHETTIALEKSRRLANYVSAVKNPPAPIQPTEKELQDAKASLQAQVAEIDVKLADIKSNKPFVVEDIG